MNFVNSYGFVDILFFVFYFVAIICVDTSMGRRETFRETEITYTCEKEGDRIPDISTGECNRFFECYLENGIWLLFPMTCGPSAFDTSTLKCVNLYGFCPRVPLEFPAIQKCTQDYEKHIMPGDCSSYFVCRYYNGVFFPDIKQCDTRHFDDITKECVNGECSQNPPLPSTDGWECQHATDQFMVPGDCSQYYKCHRCTDSPNGWCYEAIRCPQGFYYNEYTKECSNFQCPQELIELPKDWPWNPQESIPNAHPEECQKFYYTTECSEPAGRCLIGPHQCPTGHYFDAITGSCMISEICPQELLPLCDDCCCSHEKTPYPSSCTQFYRCVPCPHPDANFACMILEDCPPGDNFDEITKSCVSAPCSQDMVNDT